MYYLFAALLAFSALSAEESTSFSQEEVQQDPQINKLSEAFGHIIGKNIENLGVHFDIAALIKGLQDATAGKDSPMSEAECVEAITHAQERAFKELAVENLQKAADFLAENANTEGVVVLEPGKLHYKIEKEGIGATVEEHYTPMIRYTGKYLDGTIFGSSKEEEQICLDEAIAGIGKGIVGMKEGEKRTLYIHPDFAYGTTGYLPPNSLLTFEIEVVKADQPANPEEGVSISPRISSESPLPSFESEIVR